MSQRHAELKLRDAIRDLFGISIGNAAVLAYSGSARCRRRQRRADLQALVAAWNREGIGTIRGNGKTVHVKVRGHIVRVEAE